MSNGHVCCLGPPRWELKVTARFAHASSSGYKGKYAVQQARLLSVSVTPVVTEEVLFVSLVSNQETDRE